MPEQPAPEGPQDAAETDDLTPGPESEPEPESDPESESEPVQARERGALVLAATPIGDPRDASPRLAAELEGADIVLAEDTRRLKRLAGALGIRPADGGRLVSYHDHNEQARTPALAAEVAAGRRLVLVTDAGMPSVSDPGYRLVEAVLAGGGHVTCVPGPSAVLMALAVSGLPVDRFCFEGFPPRKPGERARTFAGLGDEPRTMVFFEAPHRLAATLEAMAAAFGGQRAAAVCRELTKVHEQVVRGPLAELVTWAAAHPEQVRGEITLVVAGAPPRPPDAQSAVAQVRARVAAGERLKDACRAVGAATGVPTRELYDAALAQR